MVSTCTSECKVIQGVGRQILQGFRLLADTHAYGAGYPGYDPQDTIEDVIAKSPFDAFSKVAGEAIPHATTASVAAMDIAKTDESFFGTILSVLTDAPSLCSRDALPRRGAGRDARV